MTTPEQHHGSEDGKDIYPPPISYEWTPLEDYDPSMQASLRDIVEGTLPEYKPREVINVKGRIEEQKIVGLALASAMSYLTRSRSDFPVVETYQALPNGYRTGNQSVIGSMNLILTSAEGVVNEAQLLIQHTGATDPQYRKARAMYLEAANDTLGGINRKKIPPPNIK